MSLKKPSASETRSEIREKNELGNSYAERLVHKIERHLEEKPEKLLLTKAGRLSLQGRKIADDQLSELLGECDNDYEEALSVLREIERSATLQGDVPHKDEVLKIVRCMRGKLVYRAHLTYVLDHYADEIPSGVRINAFAFLKEKGNPHKSSPEQSVYRAATYISKYRPQSTQKLYGFEEGEQLQERASAVEESLLEFRGEAERRANELAQQNSAIIEGDTGRGSEAGRWEIIRRRFMRFTDSLKQKLRTAVQVGLVLAVVSTSISASSASLGGDLGVKHVETKEETELRPPVSVPSQHDSYYQVQTEVSQREEYDDGGRGDESVEDDVEDEGYKVYETYQEGKEGDMEQELLEQSGVFQQTEVHKAEAHADMDYEVQSEERMFEERVKAILAGDFNYEGKINLSENYVPEDLVPISSDEAGAVFWREKSGKQYFISEKAKSILVAFLQECKRRGYRLIVTDTYRSYKDQESIHQRNPKGSAKPGSSQHQAGIAFDLYLLGDDGKLAMIDKEIVNIAKSFGIAHPLGWYDPPHFAVVPAVYKGDPDDVINHSEPNKVINELVMLSYEVDSSHQKLAFSEQNREDAEVTLISNETSFRYLTDKERTVLFRIVDKENSLEPTYKPELASLLDHGIPAVGEHIKVSVEIIEPLSKLFSAAREAGVTDMFVGSGFRSYEQQKSIYEDAADKRWVMPPGSSQHQTGLAVDVTTRSIGFAIDSRAGFEQTEAYRFLRNRAHEFGFVQTYDKEVNKDGVPKESWHFYYVGEELAKAYYKLKQLGWEGDIMDLLYWINKRQAVPVNENGEIEFTLDMFEEQQVALATN